MQKMLLKTFSFMSTDFTGDNNPNLIPPLSYNKTIATTQQANNNDSGDSVSRFASCRSIWENIATKAEVEVQCKPAAIRRRQIRPPNTIVTRSNKTG